MCNKHAAGFTLIEMIIAIVIISIGLAGVLTAFNITVKSSADPMIRKQMLSAAEEMMEEVLLKPFGTGGVPAAAGALPVAVVCSSVVSRAAFATVSDYHNYHTSEICNIDGDTPATLPGYEISVTVNATTATLGGVTGNAVKQITVTVTHGSETLSLVGWRTDYAS